MSTVVGVGVDVVHRLLDHISLGNGLGIATTHGIRDGIGNGISGEAGSTLHVHLSRQNFVFNNISAMCVRLVHLLFLSIVWLTTSVLFCLSVVDTGMCIVALHGRFGNVDGDGNGNGNGNGMISRLALRPGSLDGLVFVLAFSFVRQQ